MACCSTVRTRARFATPPLAAVALTLALPLTPACDTVQSMLASAPRPTATVRGVSLDDLTTDAATLGFDVEVTNPYRVALPLTAASYRLASGGEPFVQGAANPESSIPAGGSRTIRLPARVAFRPLLDSLSGVRPGDVVPYDAALELTADAPGVGPLTLPLSHRGELPVPAVPKVELASFQWRELSLDHAEAVMALDITNTNRFPLDLDRLDYRLVLGGTPVANTAIDKAAAFKPGQTQRVEIPLRLTPRNLGLAAFNMLTGSGASYQLDGAIEAGTPFGPVTLPLDAAGRTEFQR